MEALHLLNSFGLAPTGILHVGANYGQEFEAYRNSGAETVVYVEPIATIFEALKERVEVAKGHHAVKAVCSDRVGEIVKFNVASNWGASSSILTLGAHAEIFPGITYVAQEEMTTTTVDELLAREFPGKKFDLMVIDVQGAELMVLEGARKTLASLDAVYTEISEEPLYVGSCTWPQIDAFLTEQGFRLKHLTMSRFSQGDAFYLKNSAFSFWRKPRTVVRPGVNIALGKRASQSSLSEYSRPNDAQGAVDGTLNGSYGFHTGIEQSPWWQVDLGKGIPLDEVIVYNRLDVARERAYSFVLKLGSERGKFREVHAQGGVPFGGIDGRPARIKLDGAVARYVRIELPHEGQLHLDEVEVYPSRTWSIFRRAGVWPASRQYEE